MVGGGGGGDGAPPRRGRGSGLGDGDGEAGGMRVCGVVVLPIGGGGSARVQNGRLDALGF